MIKFLPYYIKNCSKIAELPVKYSLSMVRDIIPSLNNRKFFEIVQFGVVPRTVVPNNIECFTAPPKKFSELRIRLPKIFI